MGQANAVGPTSIEGSFISLSPSAAADCQPSRSTFPAHSEASLGAVMRSDLSVRVDDTQTVGGVVLADHVAIIGQLYCVLRTSQFSRQEHLKNKISEEFR